MSHPPQVQIVKVAAKRKGISQPKGEKKRWVSDIKLPKKDFIMAECKAVPSGFTL